MPSKTSKPRKTRPSLKKAAPTYSETEIAEIARVLADRIGPKDRVFLEGPLGAGKSTFARFLLEALGVSRLFEGSPTFSIAHEYETRLGPAVHVDFYRLKSSGEIEQAGIPDYFWGREALVLCEWISNWPEFEEQVRKSGNGGKCWSVRLSLVEGSADQRSVEIKTLS